MVCLGNQLLKKGKNFSEEYKTPRVVSKMTNKQIKDYLGSYGWTSNDDRFDYHLPKVIADPINKPNKGLEIKTGYTGDIEMFGPMGSNRNLDTDEQCLNFGGHYNNRHIKMDTYFNKVLTEAWKRGIVKTEHDDNTIYLGELASLNIAYAMKRDSVQNRKFRQKMENLANWHEQSKRSNFIIGSSF